MFTMLDGNPKLVYANMILCSSASNKDNWIMGLPSPLLKL